MQFIDVKNVLIFGKRRLFSVILYFVAKICFKSTVEYGFSVGF